MKKIISIITLCAVVMTLTACSAAPENSAADEYAELKLVRPVESDRINFRDLETLEAHCDIAVVGKIVGDPIQKNYYEYNPYFDKEILRNIITTGTVEISRVLKGDVKVGDTVNVLQRYGIIGDEFFAYDELTPMQNGDEWVFFLKEEPRLDGYWCWGDTDARYPTKNASSNRPMALAESPELGVLDKSLFNQSIYEELVEKYDI